MILTIVMIVIAVLAWSIVGVFAFFLCTRNKSPASKHSYIADYTATVLCGPIVWCYCFYEVVRKKTNTLPFEVNLQRKSPS